MKALLCSLYLIPLVSLVAQVDSTFKEYTFIVNELDGEIRWTSTGDLLQEEDTFSLGQNLSFGSVDDMILLSDMSQDGDCYYLFPNEDLHSYIGPERCLARIGTRPGKILNLLQLKLFLQNRILLILNSSTTIEVGASQVPINQDIFFYIQFDWTKEKTPINKKLPITAGKIMISKDSLLRVDDTPIDASEASNFKLYYYYRTQGDSIHISDFELRFVDHANLKKYLKKFIDRSNKKGSDLFKEIFRYVHTGYGEPQESDLRKWLQKHLGLSFKD